MRVRGFWECGSQGERQRGHCGESGVLAEQTNGEAQLLSHHAPAIRSGRSECSGRCGKTAN